MQRVFCVIHCAWTLVANGVDYINIAYILLQLTVYKRVVDKKKGSEKTRPGKSSRTRRQLDDVKYRENTHRLESTSKKKNPPLFN